MSNKKSVSKLYNSLKTINDEKEKRNAILKAYFYGFHQEKISTEAEVPFSELSFEELKQIYSKIVIENIDSVEYSAEVCVNRAIMFGFTHLEKYSQLDGVTVVKAENMPRNFADDELEFFQLSVDVILEFHQICNSNSTLTKEEDTNWDLDIGNFAKKVFSSEYLRFDKNIKNDELHKILYGY